MRIIQISDIHISSADDRPFDVDVRTQFIKVLRVAGDLKPDGVVLSGDLCFRDPLFEVYPWIAMQMKEMISCPVYVMPGNHDSQQIMHRHFTCPYHADTDEIYCTVKWHAIPVFFLDSARGVMSETQYQWLERELKVCKGRVLLFIHHPPLYCGVPFMDTRYAFQEIPRFQGLLQDKDLEFQIFCGHYHVERTLGIANQRICITPSTFFQIDATEVEFKIDHHKAGYRVIELGDDGECSSYCSYL